MNSVDKSTGEINRRDAAIETFHDIIARLRALARQRLQEYAEELRDEIVPEAEAEQLRLPLAPLPSDLARTSPFFPVKQRHLADREALFVPDMLIAQTAWGEIRYSGIMLSTFDEDILLALLAVLRELSARAGQYDWTYEGPARPLLTLLLNRHPSKRDYDRFVEALKRLSTCTLELVAYARTARRRRRPRRRVITPLISLLDIDLEQRHVRIALNPYFVQVYQAHKSVALVDVLKRSKLRSQVAKAIYRFVMSHRSRKWEGHYLTLAAAVNLYPGPPYIRKSAGWKTRQNIRRNISSAIRELIRHGILAADSRLKGDIVRLHRAG